MAIPQLVLGSFNLTDWAGVAYGTSVIAEGTSRGAPQSIEVAVKSWLQDGSIVVTQGYDNRTVTLRVMFRGTSLTAVNATEAALFAQIGIPNTLTWTPASGPAAVFDVITSRFEEAPGEAGDLAEAQSSPWRYYNISLTCAAFTRSATETVATAQAASGTTTTLVDDGSATTNWTGTTNGVSATVAVTSGAVGVTTSALAGSVAISLTRTASITSLSATPYLMVDWKGPAGGNPSIACFGDGVALSQIGQTVSPTSGFTRTWFRATTSSIAVLRLDSTSTDTPYLGATVRTLLVDNINRTDVKPALGSSRQLLRAIDVAGSARTQGSLAIEHATSSLGDVIAYFFPDGANGQNAYSPPLRPYRVSGGTTSADATAVSGTGEGVVSGFTAVTVIFDVPLKNLVAGIHLLQARMQLVGGASTITWFVTTRVNGVAMGPTLTGTRNLAVTTGNYAIYTLDRLMLPTVDVDPASSTGVVRITITGSGGSGISLGLDEMWLFNTTIGQHIQVPCGTAAPSSGGSANRLFIEPPSVIRPRPSVRIGFAADRSDSFYPTGMSSWQLPVYNPKRVNVLTVTSNALDASVTLRYFPRWHTNPAT